MESPSDTKPCPGRPKDDQLAARRRDEILRQAIAHFAASGFADTDLDGIAAGVGCAKGTLYRYFSSKADLFRESVDLVMRQLLEATAKPVSDDPLEQLAFSIRTFLAYFDEHPQYVELLILERAAFRDRNQPTFLTYRKHYEDRWLKRFEELMDQGRMRRMPPERAFDVIGQAIYGTMFLHYFAGPRKPLAEQADDLLDVLFHGLLTPEEVAHRRQQ